MLTRVKMLLLNTNNFQKSLHRISEEFPLLPSSPPQAGVPPVATRGNIHPPPTQPTPPKHHRAPTSPESSSVSTAHPVHADSTINSYWSMLGPGEHVDITAVVPREKPEPRGAQAASPLPVCTGNRKNVNLLRKRKCINKSANPFNLAAIPHQPFLWNLFYFSLLVLMFVSLCLLTCFWMKTFMCFNITCVLL